MQVVVIGAGVGGLVAALELAARGHAVTVLEQAAAPGGKMRRLPVAGHLVNAGPTVFTMRWVFDRLFRDLGLDFERTVALTPLDRLARHAWPGGARLDLFADRRASEEAIGTFAGAADARAYREFTRVAGRLYGALWPTFINATKPNPLSLAARIARHDPGSLALVNPNATLADSLARLFTDPRLRQLFGRYATYCGCSPYAAPSMLMLVAHVEQEGVWLAPGGMAGVAAALAKVAADAGALFRYGTAAKDIVTRGGRTSGVVTAAGETFPADAVVFNGDAAALARLLAPGSPSSGVPPVPEPARSLSAVTFAAVARAEGVPLLRHTVFFSDDYPVEFADLFRKRSLPRRPTVYICAEDRTDDDTSVLPGPERLLLLVNAPAIGDRTPDPFIPAEISRCQADMLTQLEMCGLALKLTPEATTITTPTDFNRLFPGTGGALYGRNGHGWMASFQRPGARTRIAGLYLAGGSVHPGPGVPMAALSGRMAAGALMSDRASTRTSHPAAMRGGTSTR